MDAITPVISSERTAKVHIPSKEPNVGPWGIAIPLCSGNVQLQLLPDIKPREVIFILQIAMLMLLQLHTSSELYCLQTKNPKSDYNYNKTGHWAMLHKY